MFAIVLKVYSIGMTQTRTLFYGGFKWILKLTSNIGIIEENNKQLNNKNRFPFKSIIFLKPNVFGYKKTVKTTDRIFTKTVQYIWFNSYFWRTEQK